MYLIEENWADNLEQGFNKYKNLKENNELIQDFDYYDLLPQEDPDIINDFSSILEEITNDKKILCISKKLFELIYDKNDLKDYHYIKYYSGNNKLIIEYENDNKAILLIDPLNQRNLKNNAKIILIEDEKKNKLFKNLLSLSSRNDIPDDYLDYIISIDSYNNKLKNILKLLIYFYYYEKDLKNNKEDIFNENDNNYYYLINPEWLNEFKDLFNYSEINDSLKLIDRKNKNINYNNLNNYYEDIISQINENILNEKKVLFGKIFDAENLKLYSKKIYNIIYLKNCYIINSQIMNIIKSIFKDNQINIKSRNIFFMDNSIYIFYDKKVIIGKLNEILLFIPKYIIVYNSKEILESEKKYLLKDTIENYINEFECDLNNPNLQILEGNGEKIGKLVVVQSDTHYNEKSPVKKVKNKIIPTIDIPYLAYSMNLPYEKFQLEIKDNQNLLDSKIDFNQVKTKNSKKNSFKINKSEIMMNKQQNKNNYNINKEINSFANISNISNEKNKKNDREIIGQKYIKNKHNDFPDENKILYEKNEN